MSIDQLFITAVSSNDFEGVDDLITKNPRFNRNIKDNDQNTLVMIATENGFYEIVDLLLQNKVPVNVPNKYPKKY